MSVAMSQQAERQRRADGRHAVPGPGGSVDPDCPALGVHGDGLGQGRAVGIGPVDATTRARRGRALRSGARIASGMVLVMATAIVARQGLSGFEIGVFRSINRLPAAIATPTQLVMQAGALPAAFVAAIIALTVRKGRLAAAVVLAGAGAWMTAKLVKSIVGRGRPGSLLDGVVHHGAIDSGLGFPSGHAALAAAVIVVASPQLGRVGRRAGWTVVAIVAIARIYVGAHLPLDVLGGAALGWTIGHGVRAVLFGPMTRVEQVAAVLPAPGGELTQIHGVGVAGGAEMAGQQASSVARSTSNGTG
jgi:membrane-associated phospholipid phosphatase